MKQAIYLLNAIRVKKADIHESEIAIIAMVEDLDNLKESYRQMKIKESRNGIMEFVCVECGCFCSASIAVDTEMITTELCPDCLAMENNPARAKLTRKLLKEELEG